MTAADKQRAGGAAVPPADFADFVGSLDVDAIAERIGLHCVAAIPELASRRDPALAQETVSAASGNIRAVLAGLASGTPPSEASAPQSAISWVSTLVQRGIGGATIPRCYVVGQAMLDLELRKAAERQQLPDAAKWLASEHASRYLYAYVEKISGELIECFERERARWMRGADSIRAEVVLDIVSGRPFDPVSAGATLRYSFDRPHVAVLVWADPRHPEPPSLARLKGAATRLSRHLGGTELIVVPIGSREVWAWTSGPAMSDIPLAELAIDPPLCAAIGSPGAGADGFVASYQEAGEARRVAGLLAPPSGSVLRYRDVAMTALITQDLDAAGRFLRSELGALADDTERNSGLRETLRAFLDEGMSWSRAADRLGVHQNTVMYRVRQAEHLLGHPYRERRPELDVALRLAAAEALRG